MIEPVHQKSSLELRSAEVQEIIGQAPNSLIRWGTTVFFVLFLLILVLSWLIKYPDVVRANFTLTSINAPKPIVARIDGKITKLYVKNGNTVEQGAVLGFIESTADPQQVVDISSSVDSLLQFLNSNKDELIPTFFVTYHNNLGELQFDFQSFNNAYLRFKSYLASGYYLAKKKLLKNDLIRLNELEKNLLLQLSIAEKDLLLGEKNYAMQETLAKQKVIAPLSLRQEESRLLSKKLPLEIVHADIIANKSSQSSKQNELLELDKEIAEQKILFLQAVNTFKSQIDAWKYRYMLIAPISGEVNFISYLQEKQVVQNGLELFYIIPRNTAYIGLMYVSQFNLGKIVRNQNVVIKFAGYPFEEYGSLKGKIQDISNVPRAGEYLITVALKNGLQTDFGRNLQYKEGMTATGGIITSDKRLIQRFAYNLRKLTTF